MQTYYQSVSFLRSSYKNAQKLSVYHDERVTAYLTRQKRLRKMNQALMAQHHFWKAGRLSAASNFPIPVLVLTGFFAGWLAKITDVCKSRYQLLHYRFRSTFVPLEKIFECMGSAFLHKAIFWFSADKQTKCDVIFSKKGCWIVKIFFICIGKKEKLT